MTRKPTYEELEQKIRALEESVVNGQRTEDALQLSKESFRSLFDDHMAVILVVNPDTGAIITANHAAATFYGWSRETLTQMNIQQINLLPLGKVKAAMKNARDRVQNHFEFQHKLANGAVRDVEVFSNRISIDGHDYLHSIIHDVTERKQADESLRASEKRYRQLFENMTEGVALHEMIYNEKQQAVDYRIIETNAAYHKHTGLSVGPAQGMLATTLYETDTPPYLQEYGKVARTGEPLAFQTFFSPMKRHFSITVFSPMPGFFATVFEDITERKRAEQELAVIAEIGRIIGSSLNIDEVYKRFAEEARKLITFDRLALYLSSPESGAVKVMYLNGIPIAGRNAGDSFPLAGSTHEELIRTRTGFIVDLTNPEELANRFPGVRNSYKTGLRSLLAVPFFSHSKVIGSLGFRSKIPNAYTERDLFLAQRIGDQIAGAIANAQTYLNLQRAEQEMAVIAEIGRIIDSSLDIDKVYERFTIEAKKLIGFDWLSVALHNPREGRVRIAHTSKTDVYIRRRHRDTFPLAGSLNERVMRTRTGFIERLESIEAVSEHHPHFVESFKEGLRSVMAVPLFSHGEVIGILSFRSKTANAYTPADLPLAERIGEQIAGAIANAELYSELQKAEGALRESEERHRLIINTLPIAVSIETLGKIVYVNPAFLTLFKVSSPDQIIGMRFTEFVSPELYDTIEKRRKTITEEKRNLPPLELNLRCMDGTFIMVVSTPMPILFGGQASHLTAFYDITERKRSEIELQKALKLLQIHVREIEDLQNRMKELATRDALTGLFNRRYLNETLERELARASRAGFPIGVIMIDIDHFKQFNDVHGHKVGDLILQALGNLLLSQIRAGDVACRYGGDEFLLILPQASKAITAERAEKLCAGCGALRVAGAEKALQATISLGVAVYPEEGATPEAVIHAADQAMYRAKAMGGNRVVLS